MNRFLDSLKSIFSPATHEPTTDSLLQQARDLISLGRFEEALVYTQMALDWHEDNDPENDIVTVRITLLKTDLLVTLVRYDEADELLATLSRMAEKMKHPVSRAYIASAQGWSAQCQGDVRAAQASYRQAESLLDGQQGRGVYGRVLCHQADIAVSEGALDYAILRYRKGLEILFGSQDDALTVMFMQHLAMTLLHLGEWQKAEYILQDAIRFSIRNEQVYHQWQMAVQLGDLTRFRQRTDEAQKYYRMARTLLLLLDTQNRFDSVSDTARKQAVELIDIAADAGLNRTQLTTTDVEPKLKRDESRSTYPSVERRRAARQGFVGTVAIDAATGHSERALRRLRSYSTQKLRGVLLFTSDEIARFRLLITIEQAPHMFLPVIETADLIDNLAPYADAMPQDALLVSMAGVLSRIALHHTDADLQQRALLLLQQLAQQDAPPLLPDYQDAAQAETQPVSDLFSLHTLLLKATLTLVQSVQQATMASSRITSPESVASNTAASATDEPADTESSSSDAATPAESTPAERSHAGLSAWLEVSQQAATMLDANTQAFALVELVRLAMQLGDATAIGQHIHSMKQISDRVTVPSRQIDMLLLQYRWHLDRLEADLAETALRDASQRAEAASLASHRISADARYAFFLTQIGDRQPAELVMTRLQVQMKDSVTVLSPRLRADAYICFAQTSFTLGLFDRAASFIDRATQMPQTRVDAAYTTAWRALIDLRLKPEAAADVLPVARDTYRTITQHAHVPYQLFAAFVLADCYTQLGQLAQAEPFLNYVLAYSRQVPQGLLYIQVHRLAADVYQQLGRDSDAAAQAELASELQAKLRATTVASSPA